MLSNTLRHGIAFVAVLMATFIVYLPGVQGPPVLDDRHNLAPIAAVQSGKLSLTQYLFEPGAGGIPRPLPKASFVLNWWLSGDNVATFKLTNIFIHLLCGVLVYVLTRRLCIANGDTPSTVQFMAWATASLWLLSPLLVSTTLYVVQRMAQLATVFMLGALIAWVSAVSASSTRWRVCGYALALLVFWPLALASKQNAASLPLLILLTEWMLLRHTHNAVRRRRAVAIGVLLMATILALYLLYDPSWLMQGYAAREFSLWQRLLTEPRALTNYLGHLLLLPAAQPFGVFHDDFAASMSLLQPPSTAVCVAILIVLALTAISARNSAFAIGGFGVAFYLTGHLVESTIFPLELYFEHRNYLPAIGIMLAIASAVNGICRHSARRWLRMVLVTLMLVVTGAVCAARVQIWRSEQALYSHALVHHPRSARAHLAMASIAFNASRIDDGLRHLHQAKTLLPASAGFGLTINELAAYCLAGVAPPLTWRQRVNALDVIGSDFYTVNAMQWLSKAITAGACDANERRFLQQAIARLRAAPVKPSTHERERARRQALSSLEQALKMH